MAGSYKHSYVFQKMKTTKETILDNYSSSQYIEVLDTLIYGYIKPIVENTDFANDLLADFIHQYINNYRRKISIVTKEKILSSLLMFFTCPPSKRLAYLKSMRLERSIFRYIAEKFLEQTKDYESRIEKRLNGDMSALASLETKVKILNQHDTLPLNSVITAVETYLKEASKFKQQILEKYTRMVLMAAQTHYKLNPRLDLDSIIQTMFLYSTYAIDKYDITQGALTSYIEVWLRHARNRVISNEAESFANVSIDQDDTYVEEPIYENESSLEDDEVLRVRELAKLVDPTGLGRLSLNIQETLTKEEKQLQYRQLAKL